MSTASVITGCRTGLRRLRADRSGLCSTGSARIGWSALAIRNAVRRPWIDCATALVAACLLSAAPASASSLYLGQFSALLDSGFGGLPPTLLEVRYTFKDAPPTRVVGRQAFYELRSINAWLNGVEYPAAPFELKVEDGLRYAPGVRRDAYFVAGIVSGRYDSDFELLAAGLAFEKYGGRPQALDDLDLPTSSEDLVGFTIEGAMDQRDAWLSFENLATGGLFSTHARLIDFSIVPVTEPANLAWLGLGLMWTVVARRRPPSGRSR